MARRNGVLLLLTFLAVGCGPTRVRTLPTSPPQLTVHSIALPGAPAAGVFLDYLAYDRARHESRPTLRRPSRCPQPRCRRLTRRLSTPYVWSV